MSERTLQVLLSWIAVIVLAVIGAIFVDCDQQSARRAECVKSHPANDCRALFPINGDNHR